MALSEGVGAEIALAVKAASILLENERFAGVVP
jgi:hypothetical protein